MRHTTITQQGHDSLVPTGGSIHINCYGNQPGLRTRVGEELVRKRLDSMSQDNSQHQLLVCPPDPKEQAGRGGRLIVGPETNSLITTLIADAVVFTERFNDLVALQSRDCPWVVLHNPKNNMVAVVHCMRDYLKPELDGLDLLTRAVHQFTITTRHNVRAYITPGISGKRFKHEQAPELTDYFLRQFGPTVFHRVADQSLSLRRVINAILSSHGIHIIRESTICTYSTPGWGSLRAERDGNPDKIGQNWVLVTPAARR